LGTILIGDFWGDVMDWGFWGDVMDWGFLGDAMDWGFFGRRDESRLYGWIWDFAPTLFLGVHLTNLP